MRTTLALLLLTTALPSRAADGQALLWQAPQKITLGDWIWGPGGEARAPQGPFAFLQEDLDGTNPKLKVEDANGLRWTVKFGGENHSEVFAARFLFAMGYTVEPSYFVRSGVITGVRGLKRAKPFVGKHGEFSYARFKLHQSKKVTSVEGLEWSWTSNPFVGSRELSGLKILIMLLSNWDAKDSRDGKGSNTAVYARPAADGDRLFYAFDDWGATLGKWGGFFSRTKWDADGFSRQTRTFVSLREDQAIHWAYAGKHGRDVSSGIELGDVRWLLTSLNGVSDEQLRAGLQASGATPREIDTYARSLRDRISQLQRLCEGATSTR